MGDPILDFFDNSDPHDPTSHEVYGKPYNQLTFGQQDYVRSREEARGIVFLAIDEPSSGNAWFVRLIFGLFLLVPSFLGFSNMSVSFSSPQAALENVPVNVFFLSLFFGSLFLMLGWIPVMKKLLIFLFVGSLVGYIVFSLFVSLFPN